MTDIITKWDRSLLGNAPGFLLQNATFVTNCDIKTDNKLIKRNKRTRPLQLPNANNQVITNKVIRT